MVGRLLSYLEKHDEDPNLGCVSGDGAEKMYPEIFKSLNFQNELDRQLVTKISVINKNYLKRVSREL